MTGGAAGGGEEDSEEEGSVQEATYHIEHKRWTPERQLNHVRNGCCLLAEMQLEEVGSNPEAAPRMSLSACVSHVIHL